MDNLKTKKNKKKQTTTKSFHAKIQLLGFILKLGSSGLACWWPEWQLTSSDKRHHLLLAPAPAHYFTSHTVLCY